MKTPSKRIGNEFERFVAKQLSLKISDGKDNTIFWRTPSSGSISIRGRKYEGDITVINDDYNWFNLIIECKTTKKGSIIPLKSNIAGYIKQCQKRYKDKKWILIVKIRGHNDIYLLCEENITTYIDKDSMLCVINNIYVYDFKKVKFIKDKFL